METIGATDITNRIAELLDRTAHGETFEIMQDGRPVARLIPAEKTRDRAAALAAVERLKNVRGLLGDVKATNIQKMAHDGHKY